MILVCSISPLKYPLQYNFIECQRELYTSPSGIIKSPGYPNNYHNNADCVYEIIVQDGKRIKIDFTSFDVQGDFFGFCLHDQLEIFDGDAVVPIGMTCGSGVRTFTSRGNRLFMRFMTDDSVTRPGFFGRYQTVDGRKLMILYHSFL